ncbi:hypothetical protein GVN21_01115 [Caulobacter sp. SLTY]|uniref:hypothetical protein n=1 Tax=Caulobacter sp. SLTY TaxID=2683262 RepID=UPI0014121BE3|nr:hypothetical protein [Caulobacter sp. SLTY]NBB13951.1 hypothetical protein [Caulobacter sp. SLTY]
MTWAKLPKGLRILIGLMLTATAVAVGIAAGSGPGSRLFFEGQLGAMPFRTGLLAAMAIGMIATFTLPSLREKRARCLMALQGLLFLNLALTEVYTLTPFKLFAGAGLICVLAYLALGRFEPKPPETRP